MYAMKYTIHLISMLAIALLTLSVTADTKPRPNVILMMADDLASIDLSCYGSDNIKTPRLDKLATQGMKLTSYYAGNPVCSPSRMALLSGSYPSRLGWGWGVLGYGFPPKTGMSSSVYTMAEAFGDAGYRTAISGKWHLGVQGMSPENQGFASAYYIRMSNNQNRDMMRDGRMVKEKWDNRTLSETFTEEVIRVINEDSDKPFFLYVPWTAPHFPADPHPDWHGKSGENKLGKYIDTVEELDHRVGQILDALDKKGIADDTIVIFTSDNGRQSGQNEGRLGPYSGMKWHSLEGGTRVPLIVRYPGKIAAGTQSDAMISAMDLFPTLTHACGVKIKLPEDAQKMDGVNVWYTLIDELREHPRTELLYWHGKGKASALRQGDWKLRFNTSDQKPTDPPLDNGPELYHLKSDLKEQNNLAARHPEKVKAMLARAKELLTEVYADPMPLGTWGDGKAPEPVRGKDVWGPWLH